MKNGQKEYPLDYTDEELAREIRDVVERFAKRGKYYPDLALTVREVAMKTPRERLVWLTLQNTSMKALGVAYSNAGKELLRTQRWLRELREEHQRRETKDLFA